MKKHVPPDRGLDARPRRVIGMVEDSSHINARVDAEGAVAFLAALVRNHGLLEPLGTTWPRGRR